MSECNCDPNDLLERERQYSRLTDTTGGVWCTTHRVWVMFNAPKEAFDARLAVRSPDRVSGET